MTEELRKDLEPAAELGRSPSGAAGSERPVEGGDPGAAAPSVGPPGTVPVGEREEEREAPLSGIPWARQRRRRRSLEKPHALPGPLTAAKKILLLDTWRRSGLPARDFAALTGLSHHTLYVWQRKFKLEGPAGLEDKPRGGPRGSRLSEVTRRAILMLKETHPDWGTERISAVLLRGAGLGASPGAVRRVLGEEGYELREVATRRHPEQVRRFERARPNELWQTDLFTFVLKRQNRRLYLVAFMDDHSRFLVGYGLHATQSAQLVIEVLRSAVASYQAPREILTDNGAQYITWRGKGAFTRECQKRGIRQIVARPRRPQTLGKIERFWGTLWRECLETAVFLDMPDAQKRIGLFIDHYNFQRPHSALGGLVPADRFFGAAPEVLKALKGRVVANALELSRHGVPRKPFYLAGNAGGQPFSVHAEGERVILQRGEGEREEIELVSPEVASAAPAGELPEPLCPMGSPQVEEGEEEDGDDDPGLDDDVPPPGLSPLDQALGAVIEEREREVPDTGEGSDWEDVESPTDDDADELEGGDLA